MHHWKLTLAYDGTSFNGWQVQPNLPTIQGTLAAALHRITGETLLPQGSGRTDAGVHALAQVASISLATPIPATNLHYALNRVLPQSIRVLTIESVSEDFHARHSARRKTYEYRIFPRALYPRAIPPTLDRICSPMLAPYVWDCPYPLDFAALENAADYVRGTHDFTSFTAVNPDQTSRDESTSSETPEASFVRTIYHSSWHRSDGLYLYRVTGSGFLHHMVRNLVGTFVEAAARRISADDIPGILAARNRSAAGPTAPARGLFLVEVEYA
ncbi:tRNA pseudouridine synthase A [Edaphobacter acidisoli]|uniref:tRNA pseudouridine synthase A n=1 Tax=Edaphobacter acidisoli TaxID=2040573 RepID=A0A916RKA9_9BACT|nr:tRNA pseudouridine(38-40) synthase TruA [Edaphobacter acidisoli]GGA57114.1 tRNA pseudouridine synthase A [Edaphobacter acidisoli]